MIVNDCRCPVDVLSEVFKRKWSILVIASIGYLNNARFNDIKKLINDISSKMLADTLKELEDVGLIQRKVYETKPPKVEYSLTDEGKKFWDALQPLINYMYSNHKYLNKCGCCDTP